MSLREQCSILQTDITWAKTAAVQQWKKLTGPKIFSFKHTENSMTAFCSWNITTRNNIPFIKKMCFGKQNGSNNDISYVETTAYNYTVVSPHTITAYNYTVPTTHAIKADNYTVPTTHTITAYNYTISSPTITACNFLITVLNLGFL